MSNKLPRQNVKYSTSLNGALFGLWKGKLWGILFGMVKQRNCMQVGAKLVENRINLV